MLGHFASRFKICGLLSCDVLYLKKKGGFRVSFFVFITSGMIIPWFPEQISLNFIYWV